MDSIINDINDKLNLPLLIEASSTRPLVLIFSANWISQSSIVEIVSQKIVKAAPYANVVCCDADEEEDLFIKYKVDVLPTAIIIKDHQLSNKIEGTFSKKNILDALA